VDALVLLADLKRSRSKPDRDQVGENVRSTLREANEQHGDDQVARFATLRGIDEFGGILSPSAPVGSILWRLWTGIHPHPARFALVRGTLDIVPPEDERSLQRFDGPAIHDASEALETMDREGALVRVLHNGRRIDGPVERLVNLLYFHLLEWTPHRLEVYQAYQELGSQEEVADRFDVTQPTVSESLKAVRARYVTGTRRLIEDALARELGGSEDG